MEWSLPSSFLYFQFFFQWDLLLLCQGETKDIILKKEVWGFPGGAVVKNPPANAGDMDLSPGPGRSHMPWSN